MKDFRETLFSIQESQNKLIKEYQILIAEYESHDLLRENEVIRKKVEEYKERIATLQTKLHQLESENGGLRQALTEQIIDEKMNIIKVSREKLNTYFGAKQGAHMNRLEAVENKVKNDIHHLYRRAELHLNEGKEQVNSKLAAVSTELDQRIWHHRQQLQDMEKKVGQDSSNALDQLQSEEVSEETMQRRIKQNQIEMKIGLNWINKIAILLIILAVGSAFKFSYSEWFNGYMKGSTFFLLGALMLAGGEWLFRKGKETFSLGLLGGGISVLYGSIFYSYFLLEIIGIYTGLGLSVLVTLTGVLLSLRYQSRTICSLALVGGYIPLFSYMQAFGLHGNAVYIAMVYLLLLNGFILLISLRKRWVIVNYISFLFNVPSMLALVWRGDSESISMVYAVITFLMYLGITLWYPFKYRSKLSWWDFSLLALNTMFSCGTLYALLADAGLSDFKGLLALIFCLIYMGLGRLALKYLEQEKETRLLFYGTSLTFALLMIPFQFGIQWVALGWLIEGIILTVFGNRNSLKQLERVGWGIIGLCLGAFLLVDLSSYLLLDRGAFNLKYSSISIGMLIITLYYAIRHQDKEAFLNKKPFEITIINVFKYVTLANVWFYLLFEMGRFYQTLVPRDFAQYGFYRTLLIAFITMMLAYSLTKVSVLYDRLIKYYCLFLNVVGYFFCLCVTLFIPTLHSNYSQNSVADYLALVVLIGINVFVFISGRDLVIALIRREFKSIELYPTILGIYLLAILTAFLSIQLRLGDIALVFSMAYLLLSIAYIMYGFRNRYVYIRRIGLGLTLFSTGKLLLYDLSFLTTGGKMIAYFCFGLVLLGISYLYQRVSSRLGETHEDTGVDSQG
ncbi:phosphopantetheine adenylyltransferase [Paenibacillus anaericanus]|uniref:DUF2339 domain-containing protein n=1 Tax=Paenibacillus anaericanus TaxID=170367 RepID=UPI00277E0F64|nr:DUF2339 domain-containing protein [Paenibacillus anaericanus]MDQ0089697.1 phosphopantetheine adenylyltransferase [Paenibacillus anaericanus]